MGASKIDTVSASELITKSDNYSDNNSDIKRYLILLNNIDFKDRQTEYFFVYAKDFDDANYRFACNYMGRYDISIYEINNYRQFCFIENTLFSGIKEITDIGLITNELKKVKDFKREVVE